MGIWVCGFWCLTRDTIGTLFKLNSNPYSPCYRNKKLLCKSTFISQNNVVISYHVGRFFSKDTHFNFSQLFNKCATIPCKGRWLLVRVPVVLVLAHSVKDLGCRLTFAHVVCHFCWHNREHTVACTLESHARYMATRKHCQLFS